MSGHSKWKTIKHKKAAADAQKSKVFTKIIKEITVCARTGGGDPTHNATLRTLIEKAREANMPQDNIARAIKKGTGELPGVSYESYSYEGYGPGGIAVLVDVLTDNKNRAVSDIRSIFTRKGGSLAENGAVNWMFDRLGVVRGISKTAQEDTLLEELIEYDVKDIQRDGEDWTITCDPHALEQVKGHLKKNVPSFEVKEAEVEFVAKNPMTVSDAQEHQAIDFLGALEDLDDVQNVYTNLA